MIIGLCDRWNKLPEEILSADASLMRYLKIIDLATPETGEG